MARNGSGSYSLPQAALANGTTADATVVQSNFDDIATALTGSMAKDGQTVPTANLPMGGYKHTGVSDGNARTQYASLGQLQDGAAFYAAAGGTADAITAAITPAITAYAIGQTFRIKTGAGANTGAVTLNVNGVGAGAVKWPDDTALVAGDLPASAMVEVTCQATTPVFHLMSGVRVGGLLKTGGTMTGALVMSGAAVNQTKGADIASATTTDIGAATGNFLDVTGTTTITGLGTVQAGTQRVVRFTGILTLTHNATSLILPGAANITTAAGDVANLVSLGSGNWRCTAYTRAALVPGTAVAMVGDTGSGGTAGIVPAPAAGDADKYLTGAATFVRPARVLLATKTPAAAASVTFLAADGLNATKYASYEWIIEDLTPSTDGTDLVVVYSTDGGATYLSSNYWYAYAGIATSMSSPDIFIQDDVSNSSGEGTYGSILIITNPRTKIQSTLARINAGGTAYNDISTGAHITSTAITGFKLLYTSGTLTGTVRIYGNTK